MDPTSSPPAGPAWARDRGLLAAAAVGVVSTVVFGMELLPGRVVGVAGWSSTVVIDVGIAVLCRRIATMPTANPTTMRFWNLVGAAGAAFGAAAAVGAVTSLGDAGVMYRGPAPAQAAPLVAGAVFLITAMVTSPLGIPARRDRVRFGLDAATVMVGVGLCAWQLSGLTPARAGAVTAADTVNALIGPAALVVVAYGVAKIALGGSAPMSRLAGLIGMVSAALESVNTALQEQIIATGHVSWRFGLTVLANLAFFASVRCQYLQMRDAVTPRARRTRSYSRMPYAALAATYALLVWVLWAKGLGGHAWVVLGGAILSSTLVVVRQIATFADNDDLLERLNAKVAELADAKEVLQRAVHERDELAGRLRYLAYHDTLTGLANRTMFLEALSAALADYRGSGTGPPTAVMIDLDDFKPVNDRHGHHAGDALLRVVARRLLTCVREGDTVARLGGDEFALLLTADGTGPDGRARPPVDIPALVRRVAAAVRQPVRLTQAGVRDPIRVRASIGTATATADTPDVAALLHHADLEMYADKQLSKPIAG